MRNYGLISNLISNWEKSEIYEIMKSAYDIKGHLPVL